MTYLVDSHCHLASLELNGKGASTVDEVIKRAHFAHVTHMLCVACELAEYEPMAKLTQNYSEVFLALGMHPLNLKEKVDYQEEDFVKIFSQDKRLIALGETGLDYFYDANNAKVQQESFIRQIELAKVLHKPLIIHAREAHHDTVNILKEHQAYDVGGIMHCYCDGIEMARQCLDMGFYISFSGIATFKGSDNVREVINYVPNDRLLVETDSPYLAPVPVRGIENEPAFVAYTLDYIANYKNMSVQELATITSQNFENLFKLKLADYPICELSFEDIKQDYMNYKLEKARQLSL